MDFFEYAFGVPEHDRDSVHRNFTVEGTTLTSNVNGRSFEIGSLTTPSLAELRATPFQRDGSMTVRQVVADVQHLHRKPENAGAFFQVASQFNLLEMVSPQNTPDKGITTYEYDRTQGPACAIACAPGTLYRNWFVPVGGQVGQSKNKQIDCLADVVDVFGKGHWVMENGYALANSAGLDHIDATIKSLSLRQRDEALGALRIGVHSDTEVSISSAGHLVTQAYCSALPVAYSPHLQGDWEAFAQFVLDASYEAALIAAAHNAESTGNNKVFLTLLGGGAFGNAMSWIIDAIGRATDLMHDVELDVAIVSYGSPTPALEPLLTH